MFEENSPLNFVHGLSTGEHVVLYYENHEYAERIEFSFIADGLAKGEICLMTTHEASTAHLIKRMMYHGLDVERSQAQGLLHVLSIVDPTLNPKGVNEGVREIYEQIFSRLAEPFRIVSTTFRELGRREVYEKEVELEKKAQATFQSEDPSARLEAFRNMDGIVMCTYPVEEFGPTNQEWLGVLSATHHAAIFAPRRSEGISIRMRGKRKPARGTITVEHTGESVERGSES